MVLVVPWLRAPRDRDIRHRRAVAGGGLVVRTMTKKGDTLNGELSVRLRRWDSPHADLLDMRYKPAGSGNP